MTVEIKIKGHSACSMLWLDVTKDHTEETLDALEQVKKESPWLNTLGCTITLVPAKLVLEYD